MKIPSNRFKLIFVKSQGPGGQNVNKSIKNSFRIGLIYYVYIIANSKAQLCVQLNGGWLSDPILKSIRFKVNYNVIFYLVLYIIF